MTICKDIQMIFCVFQMVFPFYWRKFRKFASDIPFQKTINSSLHLSAAGCKL